VPIGLKINGKDEALAKLTGARRELINRLGTTMLREMDKTRAYAIANRMAHDPGPPGDLLHQRTGHLANSLHADARADADKVVGSLGVGVPYGPVHELGLTVAVPAHAQLRTQVFGRTVEPFTVDVRAHQASYPQRAYIRPSLEARKNEILASLVAAVRDVLS
jgi:phage gpG-like protein